MRSNRLILAVLRNWKTTIGGVAAILGALGLFSTALSEFLSGTGDVAAVQEAWLHLAEALAAAGVGYALLMARDSDKSSQDSGVRP